MNKSIEEKIAALQKQIEELKLESEEGYAKTVIEAGPILVAQKAEVTIPFRFRIIEMPKLADYGLPYSKVKGDIDTSKVEPKEIDGGIVVSAADKNWAVYEMMLLPTVDDSTRIFKIKGLQCTIENPIKNQYKKISLTVNKNVDEEFLLVFYKKSMSHVLCFQGLLDFLNTKSDENDIFHLKCDSEGPKEYTLLRLVQPCRFVEK